MIDKEKRDAQRGEAEDPALLFRRVLIEARSGTDGLLFVKTDEEANEAVAAGRRVCLSLQVGDVVVTEQSCIFVVTDPTKWPKGTLLFAPGAWLALKFNKGVKKTNADEVQRDPAGWYLKGKLRVLFRHGRLA